MSSSDLGVSVVISAYNYRQFIAEAIDSVLAQTRPPLEILVMDDGSIDGTAEFVGERYAGQPLVRLISRENRGQLACFIDGTREARGAILAFLDADDRWQPNYLERVTAIYGVRPDVTFVYTNMRFFGGRRGAFLPEGPSRYMGLSVLLAAYAAKWQGAPTSALSLRRPLAVELLQDIPPRYLPKWKTRADDWLVFGADILGGRKYYLAEVLVEYRAHGNNAWLDQQSYGEEALRHSIKLETLTAHYRSVLGLSGDAKASVLRQLKHEFRTKTNPSFEELRSYSRLLAQSSLAWNKRLEHRISMWRHYLKARLRKIGGTDSG